MADKTELDGPLTFLICCVLHKISSMMQNVEQIVQPMWDTQFYKDTLVTDFSHMSKFPTFSHYVSWHTII